MSCPHATTTTLLWLYGESEESHAEHVAGCAVCQAVAAEHADVMSAMAGLSHLDLSDEVAARTGPRPVNRTRSARWVVGVTLAAAVGLWLLRTPEPEPADVPIDLAVFAALEDDPLEERFDDLAQELGDLAANVEGETL